MKVTYNGIALHDYGQVVITSQTAAGRPEAAPQWWEKRMGVKLWFKEPTYADNQSLVQQIRAALKSKQQGQLLIEDDNGNQLVNQTANVAGHDQPEDPNSKGTYLQSLQITFEYIDKFDDTQHNCMVATFKRSGASTPTVTLGNVSTVRYTQDVRRYSEFRSHRAYAGGKLEVHGQFVADPLADLSTRRAALLAAADEMRSEIAAGKDGQFVFGSINKLIRVDNFSADYDQAVSLVSWSLSASFTEFPSSEADYAQAEFTVSKNEDKREGKVTLTLSGSIAADSENKATAKLAAIRLSVAPSPTWTMLQGDGGRFEKIDGGDGADFIKLNFDETFQKTVASLVEWDLRLSDQAEIQTGMIRRTYAGHVTATAASFQTAYSAAVTKARSLGGTKHQFKLSESIVADDKQNYDPALPSPDSQKLISGNVIVNVEFSFEYRLKSPARLYAEINGEFSGEVFGLDQETVSGFIAAASVKTARELLETIKLGYDGYMIRNERVTEGRSKIAYDASSPVGVTRTPALLSAGTAVNSAEVRDNAAEDVALERGPLNAPLLGAGYVRDFQRLDFSFTIHRPKSSASGKVAIKYEVSVVTDFLNREKTSTVSGAVWAATEEAANDFLDSYFSGAGLGNQTSKRRSAGYEQPPPSGGTKFNKRVDDGAVFLSVNFEDVYTADLGGDSIIHCSLKEEIDCGGNRNVVQPCANGSDVFQVCGSQSGRRTVSGTVTATNQTLCLDWVRKQLTLPLAQAITSSGSTVRNPIKLTFGYESIPLKELKARNADGSPYVGGDRAKFASVDFSFEEYSTGLEFV